MVIVHKIVLTSKESLQFRNNSLRPLDVTLSLWHWEIVKLVGRCFPIEHSHSSLILLFFLRTMTFPVDKHNNNIIAPCVIIMLIIDYVQLFIRLILFKTRQDKTFTNIILQVQFFGTQLATNSITKSDITYNK